MNTDELEGRELDALVAERVMGWVVETHGMGPEPPYYYRQKTNRHGIHLTIPCFSTDISAAWTVVEWLSETWPGASERLVIYK